MRLYHLRDDGAAGTLTFSEVTVRPLSKEHLQTEDVFVLVAGGAAYVWIGKKSSPAERAGANEFLAGGERAAKFLEANGLTSASSVKVVKEMTEPALFKQAFHRWGASPPTAKPKSPKPRETRERREVDVDALAARNGARERGDDDGTIDSVDDAAGELKCWRVENFKLVPVAEAEYGQFHAGDSYVLRHTYDGGKRRVIYFWQGRDSTADEKGASALLAKEMDEALGGDATQVRVAQGKEPDHFLRLFRGRMIVRTGGVASGFKNANDGDTRDVDGVSLYHVRGTSDLDTRAVQVADDSACLNSGDCFILTLDATATGADPRVFVWEGSGSSRKNASAPRSSPLSWRPPSAWVPAAWRSSPNTPNRTRSGRASAGRNRTRSLPNERPRRKIRGCFTSATPPRVASACARRRYFASRRMTSRTRTSCSST